MKRIKNYVLASAGIVFICMLPVVQAQDANQILKGVDDITFAPKDQKSNIKIVLIDKNGKEKTREATVIQKGSDRRLFRFTSPASQAGIAFLSLPDDIMYLYLPAFGKERRIATHVKNQKFAGTDFSYEDMEAKPLAEKYSPKLLKTEKNAFVLELIPKPGIRIDYSRVIVSVNKENNCAENFEFYDKSDGKVKIMVSEFEKIGGYWTQKEIIMTDLQKNHKTKMIMSEVHFDNDFSDDEFTVRKLKQ